MLAIYIEKTALAELWITLTPGTSDADFVNIFRGSPFRAIDPTTWPQATR